jgi:hypothetical protein
MWYTVTLDGIPFGDVELTGAPRAIGTLVPLSGYAGSGLRKLARASGTGIRLVRSDRVPGPVVGRVLGAAFAQIQLLQDRLGLRDENGRCVAIVHILVIEFPRDPAPLVVARLREQAAPATAERHARLDTPVMNLAPQPNEELKLTASPSSLVESLRAGAAA